jgi:hypothetical protein
MPLPRFDTAQLTLFRTPFNDPDFIFELKVDGFRVLPYIDDGNCELVSRCRNPYESFKDLQGSLGKLRVKNAFINGEIVCRRRPQHFQGTIEGCARVRGCRSLLKVFDTVKFSEPSRTSDNIRAGDQTIVCPMARSVAVVVMILFFSGCQDSRVTNLEQRLNQLENKTRELESERTKSAVEDDDARIRANLEACVETVTTDFKRSLANNTAKRRNSPHSVPKPTLAEMQRQKQSKIDDCRLIYALPSSN